MKGKKEGSIWWDLYLLSSERVLFSPFSNSVLGGELEGERKNARSLAPMAHVLALVLAILPLIAASVAAQTVNLAIVGTAAVAGSILPVGPWGSECDIAEHGKSSACRGGCDYRQAYLEAVRSVFGANSVVAIDAGSYFWGSLTYAAFGPNISSVCAR